MDLKNGRITVRQVLSVPGAKEILLRELPQYMNSPLLKMAGGMTLNQVLSYGRGRVSEDAVKRILAQLKKL